VRELQGQLKFYEARVADMQREHKAVLQRLLPAGDTRDARAAAGAAGAAARDDSGEQWGADEEQMRQRCAVLEAQVSPLQVESFCVSICTFVPVKQQLSTSRGAGVGAPGRVRRKERGARGEAAAAERVAAGA